MRRGDYILERKELLRRSVRLSDIDFTPDKPSTIQFNWRVYMLVVLIGLIVSLINDLYMYCTLYIFDFE